MTGLGQGWIAVAVVVALVGCTVTYVPRAETAYSDGRYLEAAESLAAHEQDLATLSPHQQARYGRVRGLSLLRLGDHDGARRWLRYALEVDAERAVLRPNQRQQIDDRLKELERGHTKRHAPKSIPKPPPGSGDVQPGDAR